MTSIIRRIRSGVEAIESNEALFEDRNFRDRVVALDFLESDVLDRVESLLLANGRTEELMGLRQHAETVKTRLETVDERLYQRLRHSIASRNYTGAELRQQLVEYAGVGPGKGNGGDEGHDSLDALAKGVEFEPA